MFVDVVIDRHSTLTRCNESSSLGGTLVVVDQGDDAAGRGDTLATIAELLGLCGDLKECHLLTSALRQYAAIREACSLGDANTDSEWQAYDSAQLDRGLPEDYEMLCSTVGVVFGATAEAEQREALGDVLREGVA